MKIFRNIVLGIICYFLITWIGTLIKCEVLTYQHYDEFKDAYKQNTMLGDMEYFKVLCYAPRRSDIAQVYYVCEGNTLGSVLIFKYDHEAEL